MPRDDLTRIRDALEYAQEAVNAANAYSREEIEQDRLRLHGFVRLLELVGEALSFVSEPFRQADPQVPWREAIGMRHRLIHSYHDVDSRIVWNTVTLDLPPLITQLEHILNPSTD